MKLSLWCPSPCPTVQGGYTDARCQIRRSIIPGAGWGLFAASTLPARTLVCTYSGEFLFTVPPSSSGRHVVYVPGRFGYVDGGPLKPRLLRGELRLNAVGSAFMANSLTTPNCRRLDLSWNSFCRRTGLGGVIPLPASSLHTVVALETICEVLADTELTWNYPCQSGVGM